MANRVYNYPLEVQSKQMVHVPKGSEVLDIIRKGPLPYILYLVDEDQPLEQRVLLTVTTGEKFNADGFHYIGSIMLGDGKSEPWFSMHTFEHREEFGVKRQRKVIKDDRYAEDYKEIRKVLPSYPYDDV